MSIDFAGVADTYNLEANDVALLNGFFNKPEITDSLIKIEEKRKYLKKEMRILIPLLIIVFILVLVFVIPSIGDSDTSLGLVGGGIVIIGGYFALVKKRFNKGFSIKNSILPLFVKEIDASIAYASNKDLFSETVEQIYQKTGLLDSYDLIDIEEDSIKYMLGYASNDKQHHSIELSGFELKTSKKRNTSSQSRLHSTGIQNGMITSASAKNERVETNHCYIIKLLFLEPRFVLNAAIKIHRDTCNASFFGFFARIFSGKKRIEMENIDFEKQFDVFSDDPIEARMLVTPSFMARLVDFSKKTGKSYEFYFKNNEVYLKSDIYQDYMEFSLHRNVFENTIDYVKFYIEIKNIKNLVQDLGLFYYDKGTFHK